MTKANQIQKSPRIDLVALFDMPVTADLVTGVSKLLTQRRFLLDTLLGIAEGNGRPSSRTPAPRLQEPKMRALLGMPSKLRLQLYLKVQWA